MFNGFRYAIFQVHLWNPITYCIRLQGHRDLWVELPAKTCNCSQATSSLLLPTEYMRGVGVLATAILFFCWITFVQGYIKLGWLLCFVCWVDVNRTSCRNVWPNWDRCSRYIQYTSSSGTRLQHLFASRVVGVASLSTMLTFTRYCVGILASFYSSVAAHHVADHFG